MKKIPITIEVPDDYDVAPPEEYTAVTSSENPTVVIPLRRTRPIPPDNTVIEGKDADGYRCVGFSRWKDGEMWIACCEQSIRSTQLLSWQRVVPETVCEEDVQRVNVRLGKHPENSLLCIGGATADKLRALSSPGPVRIGFVVLEDK